MTTATGEDPGFGAKSPYYLIRALVLNAPREHLDVLVLSLVDHGYAGRDLDAETLLQAIAQVTATGNPKVYTGFENLEEQGDPFETDEIKQFLADLQNMSGADDPFQNFRLDDESED